MTEIWKQATGYDNYEVSNKGNVRNKRTQKILKTAYQPSGYTFVCLRKDGKSICESIRRLVMNTFNPIDNSSKFDIIHIDNDKTNNNVENLKWVTRKQNIDTNKIKSTELKCLHYMITNNVEKAIKDWNSMVTIGHQTNIEKAVDKNI